MSAQFIVPLGLSAVVGVVGVLLVWAVVDTVGAVGVGVGDGAGVGATVLVVAVTMLLDDETSKPS